MDVELDKEDNTKKESTKESENPKEVTQSNGISHEAKNDIPPPPSFDLPVPSIS